MDRCPTCGALVEIDDYWCERCATRLVAIEAMPEPEPSVPEPPPPPPPPPAPRPRRRPGSPPIPVMRQRASLSPGPGAADPKAPPLVIVIVGVVLVFAFVAMIIVDPPETEPEAPLEPVLREQTVVARSGVYSTRLVVGSAEHTNVSVRVSPTLVAPGIVSTLYGQDGNFRITEVEFPAGEVPALESTGTARCRTRGVTPQSITVRTTPALTCRWFDGLTHDELMLVHANRILLFEYETATEDDAPFTRMVATTRLYPPKTQ